MAVRVFDCDLCITAELDFLEHPHSSMPNDYIRLCMSLFEWKIIRNQLKKKIFSLRKNTKNH